LCSKKGFYDSFFTARFPGFGVQKTLVDEITDCYPLLKTGVVDAVFGVRDDFIQLFNQGGGAGLLTSPLVATQDYAVVWNESWSMGNMVNAATLKFIEGATVTQPTYTDSIKRWYAGDPTVVSYGGNTDTTNTLIDWNLVAPTIALVTAYLLLQLFILVMNRIYAKQVNEGDNGGSMRGSMKIAVRVASMVTKSIKVMPAGDDVTKSVKVVPGDDITNIISIHNDGDVKTSANKMPSITH
jgi:hypothetical protein